MYHWIGTDRAYHNAVACHENRQQQSLLLAVAPPAQPRRPVPSDAHCRSGGEHHAPCLPFHGPGQDGSPALAYVSGRQGHKRMAFSPVRRLAVVSKGLFSGALPRQQVHSKDSLVLGVRWPRWHRWCYLCIKGDSYGQQAIPIQTCAFQTRWRLTWPWRWGGGGRPQVVGKHKAGVYYQPVYRLIIPIS